MTSNSQNQVTVSTRQRCFGVQATSCITRHWNAEGTFSSDYPEVDREIDKSKCHLTIRQAIKEFHQYRRIYSGGVYWAFGLYIDGRLVEESSDAIFDVETEFSCAAVFGDKMPKRFRFRMAQ